MAQEEPDEAASTPSHISESRWQARCAVLSLLATFLLHSPQVPDVMGLTCINRVAHISALKF